MSRGWRAFSYIMGANFQAVFLLFVASDLEKRCLLDQGWLCSYKQYFFSIAIVVAAYIYFQVMRALIRMETKGRG